MAGAGVRDILLDGPWRHRDIAANGIRFHVALGEQFSPRRPLVLLLHGFGEFWWAWRHQIPALDAAGFSAAAMDLRGYGASDKTPSGYDPQTTAFDVTGVIKSLGFSTGVVVGHDWGGIAGWSALAYATAPVRAFVSVAAPHPLAFPGVRAFPRWRSSNCPCSQSGASWQTMGSTSRSCSGVGQPTELDSSPPPTLGTTVTP